METWDLNRLDVQPHQPAVLDSEREGRTIVLQLPAGDSLDEHQVHERAWLVVLDGEIEVSQPPDGQTVSGGAGLLAQFDPNERRVIRATSDARLLLLLSPWPGEGHPSQR